MTRLYFLFALIYSSLCCAQSHENIAKRKIFDSLKTKVLTNASMILAHGNALLNNAQTDMDYANAYHVLGDGNYKNGDFISAIRLLEKADDYVALTTATDMRIAINALLAHTYRYAGLVAESEARLALIESISNKDNIGHRAQILQTRGVALEIDRKFCDAIPFRLKELDLYKNHFDFGPKMNFKENEVLLFANINLSYLQSKCGNVSAAKKHILVAEQLYRTLGDKSPTYYIENYYLGKALLALSAKQTDSAKYWFHKAYDRALLTDNKFVIRKMLEEMRISEIFGSSQEKNKILTALIDLQNFQAKASKDVTNIEVAKKDLTIKENKQNRLLYISVFLVIIIGLVLYLIINRRKHTRLKEHFNKILEDIETAKSVRNESTDLTNKIIAPDLIKNSDTEDQILKNLEWFERTYQFNKKSISISQMAVLLKTNHKYVSYILKKHRNSNFYNYITTSRINYISELLKDHPKLLTYKISAIAELCGFTSHTRFTIAFKAVNGISPSQYISLLQEERNLGKL